MKGNSIIDVTMPLCYKGGAPIAATGITLHLTPGETQDQTVQKAQNIGRSLEEKIRSAKKPLW